MRRRDSILRAHLPLLDTFSSWFGATRMEYAERRTTTPYEVRGCCKKGTQSRSAVGAAPNLCWDESSAAPLALRALGFSLIPSPAGLASRLASGPYGACFFRPRTHRPPLSCRGNGKTALPLRVRLTAQSGRAGTSIRKKVLRNLPWNSPV